MIVVSDGKNIPINEEIISDVREIFTGTNVLPGMPYDKLEKSGNVMNRHGGGSAYHATALEGPCVAPLQV